MRTKFKNVANLLFIVLFASCNREGVVENDELSDNGKIAVATEITVDGVELTTRAASEAGYTTGDGLYDKGDPVTVAAFSNDGYELAAFYDKNYPSTNLGASHNLTVRIPQTFKAEFRKKSFTITVNASPTDGGTVTGGGSYNKGSSCTVTATPKSGYTFDGWYEGSTKVSSNSSYSFTVSSNRTMTARFEKSGPIENWIRINNARFSNDYSAVIWDLETDYTTEIDLLFTMTMQFYYLDNKGISEFTHTKKNVILTKNSKKWIIEISLELLPDCTLTVESFKWGISALDILTDKYLYKSFAHSGIGID